MLHLKRIRELTLQAGPSPGRPAYLSAASGLVCVGKHLYVVADDELQLGVFTLDDVAPGTLLRLFPGELPDKLKKRKKHKPDLEVLMQLPNFAEYPYGALLALGSGSVSTRRRGALLKLDAHRASVEAPRIVDFSAVFATLQAKFGELNLEGAWVAQDQFCLLQRGNKGNAANAVARYPLAALLSALRDDTLPALQPHTIHEMKLGDIDGVPLCFSDACALHDGRWLFTAVAEDIDNAIDDGAFLGAAIGMADAQDQLLWIKRVTPGYKIEGIAIKPGTDKLEVLLVTDADDPAIPSCLLSAVLE